MAHQKPVPKNKEIRVEFLQPEASAIAFVNRFAIEEQPFHLLTIFGFISRSGDQECSHCVALDFRVLREHRKLLLNFFAQTAGPDDDITVTEWMPRKVAKLNVAADFIQASRIANAGELGFYYTSQHGMIEGGKSSLKTEDMFKATATCVASIRLNLSVMREWIFKLYEIYDGITPEEQN